MTASNKLLSVDEKKLSYHLQCATDVRKSYEFYVHVEFNCIFFIQFSFRNKKIEIYNETKLILLIIIQNKIKIIWLLKYCYIYIPIGFFNFNFLNIKQIQSLVGDIYRLHYLPLSRNTIFIILFSIIRWFFYVQIVWQRLWGVGM